jgi:hypothetical protein
MNTRADHAQARLAMSALEQRLWSLQIPELADTGKSQLVKRPSLSFEFHDSRYASGPFQLTREIEPKSGKTLSCSGYMRFSPIFPAPNTAPRGNSIWASSVTPKVTPKIAGW